MHTYKIICLFIFRQKYLHTAHKSSVSNQKTQQQQQFCLGNPHHTTLSFEKYAIEEAKATFHVTTQYMRQIHCLSVVKIITEKTVSRFCVCKNRIRIKITVKY